MPVFTTNYDLPVPGPLDAPCDFPEQWCAFTDATQAVIDTLEAVADRTNPLVPLAQMSMHVAVPIVLASNSYVPYDSVIANNANMIDFDVNNTTITIKRPGRFMAISNVQFVPIAGGLNKFGVTIPNGPGTVVQTFSETYELDLATVHVGANLCSVLHVTSPPYQVVVQVSSTASLTLEVARAALAVFWFADGASP